MKKAQQLIKQTNGILLVFFCTMVGIAAAGPVAPSDVVATIPEPGTLTLNWTDNSNDELGFYIYHRQDQTSSYGYLGYVPRNTTTFTTSALTCLTYDIVVYAHSPGGWGRSEAVFVNPCEAGGSCDTLHGGDLNTLHRFSYTSGSGEILNVSICATANHKADFYDGDIDAAVEHMEQIIIATDTVLFDLLGSGFNTEVSGGSTEHIVIALYDDQAEYLAQGLLPNASGFYQSRDDTTWPDNTIYTYDRLETSTDPAFPLTISHEYVHYLMWRYVISGDYGDYRDSSDDVSFAYYGQWMDEGLAEYVGYEVVFGDAYSAFTEFFHNWDKCYLSYDEIFETQILSYADATALIYYMFSVQNADSAAFFQFMKNEFLDVKFSHKEGDYLRVQAFVESLGITREGFEAWRTAEFDSPENALNSCEPPAAEPGFVCGPNQVCLYDADTGEVKTLTGPGWVYLKAIGWDNRVDGIINNTSSSSYLYDYDAGEHFDRIYPGTDLQSLGDYNNRADAVYVP